MKIGDIVVEKIENGGEPDIHVGNIVLILEESSFWSGIYKVYSLRHGRCLFYSFDNVKYPIEGVNGFVVIN